MTFLVDANVLSEPTKPEPNPAVVDWLRRHERELAVDPIILGEVRFGILVLPNGRRRSGLERWFDGGVERVHCLPWDATTGLRWAELLSGLRASGLAMPIKDSLIAATALTHDLIVATRNRADFEKAGVGVLNPFDEPRRGRLIAVRYARTAGCRLAATAASCSGRTPTGRATAGGCSNGILRKCMASPTGPEFNLELPPSEDVLGWLQRLQTLRQTGRFAAA